MNSRVLQFHHALEQKGYNVSEMPPKLTFKKQVAMIFSPKTYCAKSVLLITKNQKTLEKQVGHTVGLKMT